MYDSTFIIVMYLSHILHLYLESLLKPITWNTQSLLCSIFEIKRNIFRALKLNPWFCRHYWLSPVSKWINLILTPRSTAFAKISMVYFSAMKLIDHKNYYGAKDPSALDPLPVESRIWIRSVCSAPGPGFGPGGTPKRV